MEIGWEFQMAKKLMWLSARKDLSVLMTMLLRMGLAWALLEDPQI
jgi:hypothetical protein